MDLKIANITDKHVDTLTKHQKAIFDEMISEIDTKLSTVLKSTNIEDYLLSLSGPAGTGKTFLTTQIARYLIEKQRNDPENRSYDFVVTAPTHKAVSVLHEHFVNDEIYNVSSKTIHSFLGIKPFIDYTTGEEKYRVDKTKKFKESTSLLIVDESSMVGSELYEFILEAVEEGRVQLVLFIGDQYQLLPVNESENSVFQLPHQYELTEVVRQAKESAIIRIATALRERIETGSFISLESFLLPYMEEDLDEISFIHELPLFQEEFTKQEKWYEDDRIIASFSNSNVDAFNREIRKVYWQRKGVEKPRTLLTGDKLRFKEAYVIKGITLFNNNEIITLNEVEHAYDKNLGIEYWNCSDKCNPSQKLLVVDPDSNNVYNDKLNKLAADAKKAKFPKNRELWKTFYGVKSIFAQVQYIYASTIHKLQGSTYETVYIDLFSLVNAIYLSDEQKYRLAYVAITRASEKVKIFIRGDQNDSSQMQGVDIDAEKEQLDALLMQINN